MALPAVIGMLVGEMLDGNILQGVTWSAATPEQRELEQIVKRTCAATAGACDELVRETGGPSDSSIRGMCRRRCMRRQLDAARDFLRLERDTTTWKSMPHFVLRSSLWQHLESATIEIGKWIVGSTDLYVLPKTEYKGGESGYVARNSDEGVWDKVLVKDNDYGMRMSEERFAEYLVRFFQGARTGTGKLRGRVTKTSQERARKMVFAINPGLTFSTALTRARIPPWSRWD
jgi:hypothetical protein